MVKELESKMTMPAQVVCPSCGKMTMLETQVIEIPVDVKIFFRIRFTARIKIQYCRSCGFLKILLNQ